MHRSIDIAVATRSTDGLLARLSDLQGVVMLSVHRGASIKPPGDLINVVALNTATDAVLSRVAELADADAGSAVVTSTVDSLLHRPDQPAVRADRDEAVWEEVETALRRHTRPNLNYVLACTAGAVLTVCAFTSSSDSTQALALVAAGIITPSFEPLARIVLAGLLGQRRTLGQALGSAVVGYVTMIVAALLMLLVLRTGDHRYGLDILADRTFREVQHPPAINLLISAAGAVAGVVMISAGRLAPLSGALVALQLLPAAAAAGIALEMGRWELVAQSVGRMGIDVAMVLLAGAIVFTYKQRVIHGRRPAMD
jgi:hypothetical protein